MPISSLHIKNFKGIAGETKFQIAPLTLFIGPNSSGKSSCIHALAALAQTVKLGDRASPLVLDDDAAYVHLGRFIEIVHSKTYREQMTIGLGLGRTTMRLPALTRDKGAVESTEELSATYTFGSSRRTQELFVASANYKFGSRELKITSIKKGYRLTDSISGKSYRVRRQNNFMFDIEWGATRLADKERFEVMLILSLIQTKVSENVLDILYLGPFRQSPRRRYQFRGSMPSEVGAQGEAAISMLASEHVQHKRRTHIAQIARWLESLGLGTGVSVSRVGTSDLFGVDITLPDHVALPIADLGYGVSQVLPVLTQCSFARAGATLLFEQPELHLHPGAAACLAQIFAEVVSKKGVHIIVETHSKDFFREIFRLLNSGALSPSKFAAYEVKRVDKRSLYEPITVDEVDGQFEAGHIWAKGLGG